MDGLYLPDGRQLVLIDRDWIVDHLPHLGNPDPNFISSLPTTSASIDRTATGLSTQSVPTTNHSTAGGTQTQQQNSSTAPHLFSNPDDIDCESTLIAEIVDETQNKWSDLSLQRLLTPYARSSK